MSEKYFSARKKVFYGGLLLICQNRKELAIKINNLLTEASEMNIPGLVYIKEDLYKELKGKYNYDYFSEYKRKEIINVNPLDKKYLKKSEDIEIVAYSLVFNLLNEFDSSDLDNEKRRQKSVILSIILYHFIKEEKLNFDIGMLIDLLQDVDNSLMLLLAEGYDIIKFKLKYDVLQMFNELKQEIKQLDDPLTRELFGADKYDLNINIKANKKSFVMVENGITKGISVMKAVTASVIKNRLCVKNGRKRSFIITDTEKSLVVEKRDYLAEQKVYKVHTIKGNIETNEVNSDHFRFQGGFIGRYLIQ